MQPQDAGNHILLTNLVICNYQLLDLKSCWTIELNYSGSLVKNVAL